MENLDLFFIGVHKKREYKKMSNQNNIHNGEVVVGRVIMAEFMSVALLIGWAVASIAAVIHAIHKSTKCKGQGCGFTGLLIAFMFGPFYWLYVLIGSGDGEKGDD